MKDSEEPDTKARPYIDLADALRYVLVNCDEATFETVNHVADYEPSKPQWFKHYREKQCR